MENLSPPDDIITVNLHHNHIEVINEFLNSGFIENLDLSSNSIKSMGGLEPFKRLKYLNLSSNMIKSIEGLGFLT